MSHHRRSIRVRSRAALPAKATSARSPKALPAGATRPRHGVALLLAAALALFGLALIAPAAQATKTVDRFIGGESGGELGQFSDPLDIAVNESTGQIYVVEGQGSRIQRLASDGTPELIWGKDVIAGNAEAGYEICTPADQCQSDQRGQAAGELQDPSGIAVDQTDGSVYVWDARASNAPEAENLRIQKFDPDGNFILMFGKQVNATTGGDVCTAASGDTCQAGVETSDPGGFGNPSNTDPSLAVSPLDGDVFAADPLNHRIQRFNPDGTFVEAFGTDSRFSTRQPRRVAVDSQGVVYASNGNPAGESRIERYDSAGLHGAPGFIDPIQATPSGGPLLPGTSSTFADSPTMGLEVAPDTDGAGPDTDTLYVLRDPDSGKTVVQQIDDPGTAAAPTTAADTHGTDAELSTVGGLGLNAATGTLYVSVRSTDVGTGVFFFDDDGTGPLGSATFTSATDITADSATLNGTLEPGGYARYQFELSSDGIEWQPAGPKGQADDPGEVSISAPATGLQPNTTYRARVVASKVVDTQTTLTEISPQETFITAAAPPAVETLGSAKREDNQAELRARIDPQGSQTFYRFEWGPAGGGFPNRFPIPDALLGSGNQPQLVAETLTGLLPDTAYHYRIVAYNYVGGDGPTDRNPQVGDAVTFTTEETPAPRGSLDRAYELVSPADKVSGVGVGPWFQGLGNITFMGFAAHEGERFAVQGNSGSVLVDGAFSFGNDWALADRIDDETGWVSHSPISHPVQCRQTVKFLGANAATPDLSRLGWRTNNDAVAVFPEVCEWPTINPVFVSDWGSAKPPAKSDTRWEIFGPVSLDQVPESVPTGTLCDLAFSADGSRALCATNSARDANPVLFGLAGDGDPTWRRPPDPEAPVGRVIYVADTSSPPADRLAETGERELVSVCTEGTELPAVQAGKLSAVPCPDPLPGDDVRLVSRRGASLTATPATAVNAAENAVSANGSRIFFMAPDPHDPDGFSGPETAPPTAGCEEVGGETLCPTQLYVRQENPDGSITTRWISRPEVDGQDASLAGTVRFEGATPDGSKVFFRTNAPLTADDPNGEGSLIPGGVKTGAPSEDSWDLYRYDFPEDPAADIGTGDLTRISAGPTGEADCNSPLGGDDAGDDAVAALRHLSEDGDRAYFTCQAPLPGAPIASNGTTTEPGGTPQTTDQANLYLYDADRPEAERWRFIARMPRGTDGEIDSCATTGAQRRSLLQSSGAIANYAIGFNAPNSSCVYGSDDGSFITFWTLGQLTPDDPDSTSADIYAYDAEREELSRITAPQRGAPGGAYPCGSTGDALETACHGDGGYYGRVNPYLGVATDPLTPGDRIAFFQSKARLAPEDTDDHYDVYQWRNGELSLISSGASDTHGAFYMGNDTAGRNVYLATQDPYTWQDTDAVFDIYTARVDGGIDEPPAPATCEVLAGACQSAPAAAPPAPKAATRTQSAPPSSKGGAKSERCSALSRRAGKLAGRVRAAGHRATKLRAAAARTARRGNPALARKLQRRSVRLVRRARAARRQVARLRVAAARCQKAQAGKALAAEASGQTLAPWPEAPRVGAQAVPEAEATTHGTGESTGTSSQPEQGESVQGAAVTAAKEGSGFGAEFGAAPINDHPDAFQSVPAIPEQQNAFWAGTCDRGAAPAIGEPLEPGGGIGTRPSTVFVYTGVSPASVPAPETAEHCLDPGVIAPTSTPVPYERPPAWRLRPIAQAGAHPDGTTTQQMRRRSDAPHLVDGQVDNIYVELPPGFAGDPSAVAKCTARQFAAYPLACPSESQVGVIRLNTDGVLRDFTEFIYPLYNLEPRKGNVAELGFGHVVNLTTVRLVAKARTSADHGVTAFTGQIPAALPLAAQAATLWGVPWAAHNDVWRAPQFLFEDTSCAVQPGIGSAGTYLPWSGLTEPCRASWQPEWGEVKPFINSITGPCDGSRPVTRLHMDSYHNPGRFTADGDPDLSGPGWKSYASPAEPLTGCEKLGFDPDLTLEPDSSRADSPTGLEAELTLPQNDELPFDSPDEGASQAEIDSYLQDAADHWRSDAGLATAHLKDTTVTLPPGMTINPAGAAGQGTCTTEQIGLKTTEGAMPSPIRFDSSPVRCPLSARIGTVVVETPLLDRVDWPEGHVYLASQGDNPFASDFAIYLVLESPDRGLRIKLAGEVTPDPESGQLTTTFAHNPQLPFDRFKLRFKGGETAPLATPPVCGTQSSKSSLSSWARPDEALTVGEPFRVRSSPAPGCASGLEERPFEVGLNAGASSSKAKTHTAFAARFTRGDGHQEIEQIELETPEGFTASLRGIPYCSESGIARAESRTSSGDGARERRDPSCPSASKLGRTLVGAGSGPSPFYVSGNVYLAGPYKEAPLSMVFIVPALAGPFDLGVQVVRTQLQVDDRTAQITAVSDEIPKILRGIPLRLRDIRVLIDRDDFALNPTSCETQQVKSTVHGSHGATDEASNRFQIAGCAALGFEPRFSMTNLGKGRRSTLRSFNPPMRFTVMPREGDANLGPTQVTLPSSVILDQGNIRTVCTRDQFASRSCPEAAIYGFARAWSPLLDEPVQGPVYLGSSNNPLPDIIADLKGQVDVVLQGQIDSAPGGRIRNTFNVVPDVPVTRFDLTMFGGQNRGVLVNSTDLCRSRERGVAAFNAQNGRTSLQRPPVGLTFRGCGRVLRLEARRQKLRRIKVIRAFKQGRISRAQAKRILQRMQTAQRMSPAQARRAMRG